MLGQLTGKGASAARRRKMRRSVKTKL